MSLALKLCRHIRDALLYVEWEWPQYDPDAAPIVGPTTLDAIGLPVEVFVAPQFRRQDIGTPSIVIAPMPDSMQRADLSRDRIERFYFEVEISVVQRIGKTDDDIRQPGTLRRIESIMSFSESVGEFIASNKTLQLPSPAANDDNPSLLEFTFATYEEPEMVNNHVYLAAHEATYLVRKNG